jgi:hypothetical protein
VESYDNETLCDCINILLSLQYKRAELFTYDTNGKKTELSIKALKSSPFELVVNTLKIN